MYFQVLQLRLAAVLRHRVERGEFSERGLARRIRISQPHIHNLLKGVRMPSPALADAILRELGLNVLDLLEPHEQAGCSKIASFTGFSEIPVLEGLLGPGHPFPGHVNRTARYMLPDILLTAVTRPVVAELVADPAMTTWFNAGSRVLLDRSGFERAQPVPSGLYAVLCQGQGLLRHVRLLNGQILLSPDAMQQPETCHSISLADRHILEVVKAKAVWIGRPLESFAVAQQSVEKTG